MSLSDDLTKMDTVSEATVWKIYRQLTELKAGKPTIDGVEVAQWATRRFEWEEAKFQLKTPLRELCESISTRLGGLDEELKTKLAEYNGIKGALQQSERKAQGNLMARGLTDIVKEEDMRGTVGSDYVSTLLLVVPKHRRHPRLHPCTSHPCTSHACTLSAHPLHAPLRTLCTPCPSCHPSAPSIPSAHTA